MSSGHKQPQWRIQAWELSRYTCVSLLGMIKGWDGLPIKRDAETDDYIPTELTREDVSSALPSPRVNSLAKPLLFSRMSLMCGLKISLSGPISWTPHTRFIGSNV